MHSIKVDDRSQTVELQTAPPGFYHVLGLEQTEVFLVTSDHVIHMPSGIEYAKRSNLFPSHGIKINPGSKITITVGE